MIMKKFIFTLILLSCITIYADGQTDNKHFSYTTYIGTGLSMSQPSCTPLGVAPVIPSVSGSFLVGRYNPSSYWIPLW